MRPNRCRKKREGGCGKMEEEGEIVMQQRDGKTEKQDRERVCVCVGRSSPVPLIG